MVKAGEEMEKWSGEEECSCRFIGKDFADLIPDAGEWRLKGREEKMKDWRVGRGMGSSREFSKTLNEFANPFLADPDIATARLKKLNSQCPG